MYQSTASQPARDSETSYEIHRRTKSGWEFWAIRGQVADAIIEAKQVLRHSGTEAVRVVGNLHDPATGLSTPNTLFRASSVTGQDAAAGHWLQRGLQRIAALAQGKPGERQNLPARLTAGLAVVCLGTAITWLRS